MAKIRCKETTMDSFFGNLFYEHKVSKSHFLRRLDEVIDWDRFIRSFLTKAKGE